MRILIIAAFLALISTLSGVSAAYAGNESRLELDVEKGFKEHNYCKFSWRDQTHPLLYGMEKIVIAFRVDIGDEFYPEALHEKVLGENLKAHFEKALAGGVSKTGCITVRHNQPVLVITHEETESKLKPYLKEKGTLIIFVERNMTSWSGIQKNDSLPEAQKKGGAIFKDLQTRIDTFSMVAKPYRSDISIPYTWMLMNNFSFPRVDVDSPDGELFAKHIVETITSNYFSKE